MVAALLALAGDGRMTPPAPGEGTAKADCRLLPRLRPGDVVFISVPDAFWAQIAARWSLKRYGHGHVGMVVAVARDRAVVVHAGGSPTRGQAKVRRAGLCAFADEATRIDVFRPTDERAAQKAARAADGYAAQGLTFDSDFSLATTRRLYCTEMIWRALSAGYGRDILPAKSRLAGRAAVLPRDLETAPVLRWVGAVVGN